MPLLTHQVTSKGGRQVNEDAVEEVAGDRFALFAVADGLGGHGGGELAARRCVEAIAAAFAHAPGLSDATLQGLVDEADRAVAGLRLELRQPMSSMRTTVALLAVCGDAARWAHVGDSRVYWFRKNVLMHRTRDHSVSELVRRLEDGLAVSPADQADRHRLLRAVGAGKGCRVELGDATVALQTNDAFLLCSDGVWNAVADCEITACLSGAATPLDWCVALEQRLTARMRCDTLREQDNYSMMAGMVVS
jgi:PPM family protein phosphatase